MRGLKSLEEEFADLSDAVDEIANDKTIVHSGASTSTMKVVGRVHADVWGIADTNGDIAAFEGVDDAVVTRPV